MDKEELFRKYIDNELSPSERVKVEMILEDKPDDLALFQSMQEIRQRVLKALETLNPSEVQVPRIGPDDVMRRGNRRLIWSIAASVIVLMGMSLLILLSLESTEKSKESLQFVEMNEEELFYDELDYYISPNRCWNERKTIMTFIEIK